MNPTQYDPFAGGAALAEPIKERTKPRMAGSRVDAIPIVDVSAVFESINYRSAEEKFERQEGEYDRSVERKQATSKDGVPLWSIKLSVVMREFSYHREKDLDIKLTYASRVHPDELLGRFEPVQLAGLVYNVMAYENKPGFIVWWQAADVLRANGEPLQKLKTAA